MERNCAYCHNPLQENAKFCAFCGRAVEQPAPEQEFCRKCGKPLEEGAAFCVFCGNKVERTPAAPQYSPVPPVVLPAAPPYTEPLYAAPPTVPPIVQPAASVPKTKRKGKTGLAVALVLILLVVAGGAGLFLGLSVGQGLGSDESMSLVPTQSPTEETTEALREPVAVTLTVAVAENEDAWIQERVDAFRAAYPEYDLTVNIQHCNGMDATSSFAADPSGAPDVFMYTNDQTNTYALMSAGLLAPLTGEYLETVCSTNAESMVNAFTATDGNVYGFPYAASTWFLYYNKTVFSEEDVKSLETMLEKGGVGIPVNNSWYLGGFYAAGGASFFGPNGTDADAGVQLHNGEAVTKYLIDLVKHRNFYLDDSGGDWLRSGKVSAFFSGYWLEEQVRDWWGDDMAVAVLPAIRLNGENCQLRAFANGRGIGVNAMSENREAAMEFAAFLVSEESQLARYRMCHVLPVHLNLADHPDLADDPVAVTTIRCLADCSMVQPSIEQMQFYWGPMGELGQKICNGQVTAATAANAVKETESYINGGS